MLNDGTLAVYFHLRQHSLTNKSIGDTVYTGEFLGIVGSSGMSPQPHLHLELWDNSNWGELESSIDPFWGDCNESSDASLWINQEPYYNSSILNIITHSSPPVWHNCEPAMINHKTVFCKPHRLHENLMSIFVCKFDNFIFN